MAMNLDGTLTDLKRIVGERVGIQVKGLYVRLNNGKKLLPNVPLRKQGILNNTHITLTGRLRGGYDFFSFFLLYLCFDKLPLKHSVGG